MSEIRPIRSGAALPAERKPRGGLPNLDVHLEAERLVKRYSEAITKAVANRYYAEDLRRDSRFQASARRELVAMPSEAELTMISADLTEAMEARPDRKATQAAVAVLFDSRVRGPQNPEVYLDALVYDLVDEGFPPAVVVAACQTLRRESTFTPEIAEVIEACRKKARSYRAVATLAHRLSTSRRLLEEALKEAEPPPVQPQRTESPDWDGGEAA